MNKTEMRYFKVEINGNLALLLNVRELIQYQRDNMNYLLSQDEISVFEIQSFIGDCIVYSYNEEREEIEEI